MKRYIETKIIKAKPMTKNGYNKFKGLSIPINVEDVEGYLVEYADGYISWSPKKPFEEAYRESDNLTFGLAVELLKKGFKVARKGWNGKGMFVVYQKGYPDGIPCNKNTAEAYGYEEGTLFKVRPYLQMRCADGTHQMWLASQSDILEEDWYVVE